MRSVRLIAIAVIAVVAFASSVIAETRIVEIDDVRLNVLNVVELGAQFSGITEVTVRAVGMGGRGSYICGPSDPGAWYDLDLRICAGAGCVEFPTTRQVGYDVLAAASVDGGNWAAWEQTPNWPLVVSTEPRGPSDAVMCYCTEMEMLPVSRVVISVTADAVVGAATGSWGAVKCIYRDGVVR